MGKEKFIATFIVAVVIITGGYFLASKNPEGLIAAGKKSIGNKLGIESAIQDSGIDGVGEQAGTLYTPAGAGGNITKMVAQSMFLKMKAMDEDGTNPFGELDITDPKTRALVEDSINNVPQSIFETRIDDKDIKISADNSKNAKLRYLEGIAQITKNRFPKETVEKFRLKSSQELIDNLDKDCFQSGSSGINGELSRAYEEAFNDYRNLTVPSAWVGLHKSIIAHFKELKDIHGAFENCKEDPIRAYVGIDRLPKVYAQTKTIQKTIDTKAAELGLR